MKNLTEQAHISFPICLFAHLVVFESAIAIISALVMVTSFYVIKLIYSKKRRSRTDLLFATASISDIGVGLFRLPFSGLLVACTCTTFVKCSTSVRYLKFTSNFFPSFSYLITTVIAIDRLLLLTKHNNYKTFVTRGRLKIIIGLAFALSAGYTLLAVYYGKYIFIASISFGVILPLIIVVAYMCILCYVYRRSNAMSHCKVSGKINNKKLARTIMLILVSQSIFILPFISLNLSITISVHSKLYHTLLHWFFLLWNCQFFVNGMIFLINQRENTRKMRMKSEAAVCLKTWFHVMYCFDFNAWSPDFLEAQNESRQ